MLYDIDSSLFSHLLMQDNMNNKFNFIKNKINIYSLNKT